MSNFSPSKLNKFLLFKLPSAYFTGVRVQSITNKEAISTVKFRWINQNPFKSLYFAVQCMASELSTGILMLKAIAESKQRISMLVTYQTGTFTKKAIGRIRFICKDGERIKQTINKAIATGEGQTVIAISEGFDEQGDSVAKFEYTWSVKVKSKK